MLLENSLVELELSWQTTMVVPHHSLRDLRGDNDSYIMQPMQPFSKTKRYKGMKLKYTPYLIFCAVYYWQKPSAAQCPCGIALLPFPCLREFFYYTTFLKSRLSQNKIVSIRESSPGWTWRNMDCRMQCVQCFSSTGNNCFKPRG